MTKRDQLEAATDRLTDLLDDAESFFMSRNRCVRAAVPLGDTGVSLSWERHGSDWRMIIGAKTIEEANRVGRVLAALHLDALLTELEKNEMAMNQDLFHAIETAAAFVKEHPATVQHGTDRDGT